MLGVAACQSDPPAPSPAPEPLPPPSAAVAPSAGLETPQEPPLCNVLAAVVATEAEGFARLRGRSLGAGRWRATTSLPGSEQCTIEGEAWPRARYSCAGASFAADRREAAAAAFEALADDVNRCLDSPIWFPRSWRRGTAFEFAMGERLQTWTDYSTAPPSQVVLKVQQDATGRVYRVHLGLAAVP